MSGPEIKEEAALKIASAFSGLLNKADDPCGAVTAAHMVLGYYLGAEKVKSPIKKIKLKRAIEKFDIRFSESQGSLQCSSLRGIKWELSADKHIKGNYERCPDFVKAAADILEALTG